MNQAKLSLIRPTLRRLRTALKTLIYSEAGPRAVVFIVLLFLMMLALNGINVINSFVGRDFISSIEHRNLGRFQELALLYVGVFAVSAAVGVMFRYCEESLGLLWRHQLTKHLTAAYLLKRAYHRPEATANLANPDQRLADDVRAFATTTLSFTLLIVNGTITAISFSGVLWSISPRLFLVAVAYAVCGSLLTIWVGRSLVKLSFNQSDLEADFRTSLIHVRQNAESIALSHREARFNRRIQARLSRLVGNAQRMIAVNRNLGFCTSFYNYLIQIIPALIIAPLFIAGEVEFGVITQSAMAFATLLGAFSLIVTQFQSISAFSAVISRLTGLSAAIHIPPAEAASNIVIHHQPGPIVCENLTLLAADDGQVLVERLNLAITPGSRWLVTSSGVAAKAALFRALAGLPEQGDGGITRPGRDETFFLPERPYLPPGTLREALLRTVNEDTTPDGEILAVLEKLHVADLVARVGGLHLDRDWEGLLSNSEQHLLGAARVLLARPTFAILDRPGSSLAGDQIAAILDLLTAQGIGTVVFAKNGESLLRYDARLEILADGQWRIQPADSRAESGAAPA